MNIDTQRFLDLVEATHRLASWDIEATDKAADYGTVLCISVKPFGRRPKTFCVTRVGDDRRVVREAAAELAKYDAWVTYFGKGYDVKFVNSRLIKHGLPPLPPTPHADLYFSVARKLLTGRRSMAHLATWLGLDEEKMSISPDTWAEAAVNPATNLRTLRQRCESDTRVLEHLYRSTRHLLREMKRDGG